MWTSLKEHYSPDHKLVLYYFHFTDDEIQAQRNLSSMARVTQQVSGRPMIQTQAMWHHHLLSWQNTGFLMTMELPYQPWMVCGQKATFIFLSHCHQ
jgi:hypothetical protein